MAELRAELRAAVSCRAVTAPSSAPHARECAHEATYLQNQTRQPGGSGQTPSSLPPREAGEDTSVSWGAHLHTFGNKSRMNARRGGVFTTGHQSTEGPPPPAERAVIRCQLTVATWVCPPRGWGRSGAGKRPVPPELTRPWKCSPLRGPQWPRTDAQAGAADAGPVAHAASRELPPADQGSDSHGQRRSPGESGRPTVTAGLHVRRRLWESGGPGRQADPVPSDPAPSTPPC